MGRALQLKSGFKGIDWKWVLEGCEPCRVSISLFLFELVAAGSLLLDRQCGF
jgi:hypothetical protein